MSHVTVNRLIAKIRTTGSMAGKIGSGRPRSASTQENKSHVEEIIQSQEGNPGTHKSLREIASDLQLSKFSVQRKASDLKLKPYKRIRISRKNQNVRAKRKTRCRNLNDRFLAFNVERIIFTDKKNFTFEKLKIIKTIVFMGNGNEIFIHFTFIVRVIDFQET